MFASSPKLWQISSRFLGVRYDCLRILSGSACRDHPLVGGAVMSSTKPHVAHNSGNNEWYTPPAYIQAARQVMGSIDTDPASSEIANRTVGAAVYFTKDDNGLIQKWHGNIWLNPPYRQPAIRLFCEAVVQKYLSGEIEQAVVLVNNGTETAWGQTLLGASSAVCSPRGRIKFVDPEGRPSGAPLQGQAVAYLGKHPERFKQAFSQFGLVAFPVGGAA